MDSDSSSDYDRLDALLAQNLAPISYKLEPCAQQAELNASVLLSASEDSEVEMGTGVSSVAAYSSRYRVVHAMRSRRSHCIRSEC
eukprot:14415-Pleurochrysis_carterae.AAC.1